MSECTGTLASFDRRSDTLERYTVWEKVVTFDIVSGDTTGAATIPINGLLQKIIVKVSDFTTGNGTVDVSLTDDGDNTVWSVTNLADPATYTYSVSEPFARCGYFARCLMDKRRLHPLEVSDAAEVFHMKLWEGTIAEYPFNSYAGTLSGGTGTPTPHAPGFVFDAAKTQYIDIGAGPASVKTVSRWIKQDDISGNEYPLDLNGTSYLSIESGVVTVNGFTAATLYVNGAVGETGVSTIKALVWNHIAITDTTAVNATDLDIGRVTAAYYDGSISDVRLYSTVRTAANIRDFYNQTRWRYGV